MIETQRARPVLLAFATGFAFFILYFATQQRIPINDAYQFMQRVSSGDLRYSHMAYLPALWIFKKTVLLFYNITPLQNLTWFSAVCGGVATGTIFHVAARFFNCNKSGFAAALLLGLTPGFWYHGTATGIYAFHAMCTTATLAALLRCLRNLPLTAAEMAGVAVAVAAAPTSHLSAAGVALPVCATAIISLRIFPGGWKRVWIALGAGGAIFLAIYGVSHATSTTVSGFQSSIIGNYYKERIDNPSTIPPYLLNAMKELLLYSTPASIFILGGLAAAARHVRGAGWVLAAWFAGYLGVCSLIGDRFFGSYYLSTFAVQVLLAVAALRVLVARSPWLGAGCVAAGMAPAIVDYYFFGAGVWVAMPLGIAVFFIIYRATREATPTGSAAPPRRTFLLYLPAILAAAFSILTILPNEILKAPEWELRGSPDLAARGRRLLEAAPANCNFLVTESDPVTAGFWNHIFCMNRPDNSFCIIFLDHTAEKFAELYGNDARQMIAARIAAGESVWVVGNAQAPGVGPRARAFWDELLKLYIIKNDIPERVRDIASGRLEARK